MAFISSASYSALRSLQSFNAQLDATQNRISTGLKVASAKDGAAAWSAAVKIRSEISRNDAIKDSVGFYQSAAETASAAASSIVDALTSMKTAVTAYGNTTDANEQTVYAAQIAAAQKSIVAALAASKTGSLDWLAGVSTTTVDVTVGVDGSGALLKQSYTPPVAALTTTLTNTAIDGSTVATFVTTFTTSDMSTAGKITSILADINTSITDATTAAAGLGAFADGLASSKSLLSKFNDIKNTALSNLVDANMEEESAKLSALQVKQQLATQALSIANQSGQNVLRLFQ